jgi:4-hydroxybenzoate polyprenyltransferase
MGRGLTTRLPKLLSTFLPTTMVSARLPMGTLQQIPIISHILLLEKVAKNFWLFTKSDIFTFAVPNTIFGFCCVCVGQPFVFVSSVSAHTLLWRILSVLFFNCSNLLLFNLANQRLWESVVEDKINKPWRPIPSDKMTRSEVRKALQLIVVLVLAVNHYGLHAGAETACIISGTWVYNDLKASDDSWISRNAIIALAFGVFNWSSLKVAIGGGGESPAYIMKDGRTWIWLFSGVIFTTVHMQDMMDQLGDRARGRNTAPLVIGDRAARWSLAIPIFLWSPVFAAFFGGHLISGVVTSLLGTYIAWRCLCRRSSEEDCWTWQLWCAWTALLSLMPVEASARGIVL